MTPKEFKRIAEQALLALPEEFKPYVERCLLKFERRPDPELLRELEMPEDDDLFGLYEGPSLTEQHLDDPPDLPPSITLFYEPLLQACDSEEDLAREIQTTVLHEIGHHFGLDEDRLEELGFG